MKLELWLDESGTFEKDGSNGDAPSIIGGVLTAPNQLGGPGAKAIIDAAKASLSQAPGFIHGTEIPSKHYGEFALDLLTQVTNSGAQLVVFENQERLTIVDGDMTYLNLFAQGVVQLFQQLAAEYPQVEIKIFAARRHHRSKMEGNNHLYLIEESEYSKRIQERITLAIISRSLELGPNFRWSFQLGSARKDPELQIADVVCHSWFRRDSKKFSPQQRSQLMALYKPENYFSVIQRGSWTAIQRYLSEGSVGIAIFEYLASPDLPEKASVFPSLLAKRVQTLSPLILEGELGILVNRIKTLIRIDRQLHQAQDFIDRIRTEVLPALTSLPLDTFNFDILFLRLTVATHQGDLVQADKLIEECDRLLPKLAGRWESLDYYFNYKIRASIHHMNMYNFPKVIESMDALERTINDTLSLFPLADGFSKVCQEMKSDIRAKALGTRLQARIFMIRQDKGQIALAREDFQQAVDEFGETSQSLRQYQYRSQLECESNNFQDALSWLVKSFSLPESTQVQPLLKTILDSGVAEKAFGLMHYARLMAEATIQGQLELATELYQAWVKLKVDEDKLLQGATIHPFQIIHWKLGTTLMGQKSVKAALKKYQQALEICTQDPKRQGLYSMALAIAMERASGLMLVDKQQKEAKAALQEAVTLYKRFMEMDKPQELQDFFQPWGSVIDDLDKEPEKGKALLALSRRIPY